jgi:CRP/FNR family cyclic AMP-dependent transcriptional regulator
MSAVPHEAVSADVTAGGSPSTIALLRVDVRLREAIAPAERNFADRVLIVPRWDLAAGPWSPEALLRESTRPCAALLLRGVIVHETIIAGRSSATLLGPGDVFRPWRPAETSVPCTERWTARAGATVAVLDERFVTATRRWPGLSTVVYERLAEQLEAASVHAAIVGLPRVEERVLALLWHLADRWGIVRGDGVVVRLTLTHALIGCLVGAQRPTVSLALRALADAGLLWRGDAGAWILAPDSRTMLASDGAARVDYRRTPPARRLGTGTLAVADGDRLATPERPARPSPVRGR